MTGLTAQVAKNEFPESSALSREQHFTEFVSDDKLADLAKWFVPDNTERNTRWALKNFDLWRKTRNKCQPEDPIPEDFFQCSGPQILNRHLCFVLETRKSNGERYPPATLHHLLCGLLSHFRQQNTGCPNFMRSSISGTSWYFGRPLPAPFGGNR